MDSKNVETKNKPNISEKSKPKAKPSSPSKGTKTNAPSSSSSRTSKEGGSNASQSRRSNQNDANDAKKSSPNDKYKQTLNSKSTRHNSNNSPADKNHQTQRQKKNFNPNYKSTWYKKDRNSRWNPAESRYRNLTWQRPYPSNDEFHNRKPIDSRSQEINPFKYSYNNYRENNSRQHRPFRSPQQNTTFFGNVQEGLVIQTQSLLETSLVGFDIQNTSREKEHPTKEQTEQAQIEQTREQSNQTVEEPFEPIVESVGEGLQDPQGCDEAPEAGNSFFFEHKVFEAVNSDFGVHDSLSQSQEPALDPLDALNYLQQRENQIKSEPLHLSNDYETLDVKPELADLDFNLSKCIDSDSLCPLISVIPISRLIKSELEDLNRVEIIAPTTPAKGKPTLKPNLVQRRKKLNSDGSLSENLVQRVANMDKVGIKNVINSSGTKYDAALKIQARKKLREEIRKQLKSMNFTPQENCGNSVIIPDEIVDSMNIPAVVLDEIRKAFGIVLLENKVLNAADELEPRAIEPPPRFIDVPPKSMEPPPKSIEPPPLSIEPPPLFCPSPVAVTRPAVQSPDLMTKLKMMKDNDDKEMRRKRRKSIETVVVIDSSSSGSDESSSSSSDSDSSSTSSGSDSSTTSSFKRRRRKKRILEANVVGNFEKLILPNLKPVQRRRYKEKYSKTTKGSLLYIHNICVRANRHDFVDRRETLRVKKNLSSADNAQALEFLMKAILGLFEKQKEIRQRSKVKGNSNPVREVVTSKSKDSTCNSVNDSPKQQHNEQIAKSAHESTKVDETPPPSEGSGSVDRKSKDSISESACSAQGVSPNGGGGGRRLVASETNSGSETANENDNSPSSRPWKSPGEKKFVPMELPSPMPGFGLMQPPPNTFTWDIDSLKSQSAIGDEAVNSIREIDVKLMELHQRRMYIEEMVLKLQKDKMEVEFLTMKLQNEKFTILNSALANASSSVNATKRKTDVQSPSYDRSRKRHCDREEADKTDSRSTRSSQSKRSTEKPSSSSSKNDKTSSRSSSDKRSGKSSSSKSSSRSEKSTSSSKTEKKSEVGSSKESSRVKSEESTKQKSSAEVKSEVKTKQKMTEEVVKTVEVPQVDYSNVPNGSLDGWKLPITQIIVVGEAIIAASEDGNIYKFNIRTRVLESKFSKHTEAITQIFSCSKENFIYTTSLDGFLKKTSIENFGLEIQSLNLQEPLQSIDIEWSTAFVGSRWGNIFTYDIKNNCLSESLLCSSKSSIIAIKATKEGPRKILIVSSKGNQISFRDAMTGLLLRTLDIPESLHIYSILLDDGCVFCGTQRNEIYQFNFTTGARMAIFHCGNGAVSMKLYKERYIFVGCYDGFVYVLDKQTGCQIGRFPGSGKMILAIEIAGDKIITSAKDNTTMQIADIPKYIVTKAKS